MEAVSVNSAKKIASASKPKERGVTFPITGNVITHSGKPTLVIPRAIALYYGFADNWDFLQFDISPVEGGILLTFKRKESAF